LFCGVCLIINLIQNTVTHNDLAHNLLYALLNQGVSVGTAVMIRSLCGAASDLFRFRRLVVFAAITLAAAGIEALVGQAVCILLEGSSADAFNKWLQWAGEDALGLLIATPAVLLPLKRRRMVYASDAGHLERWALLGAVAAVGALAFAQSHSALALLIYPLLMLVACRAGPVWVSAAVLVNAFEAAAMTVNGLGPLALLAHGDPMGAQLLIQLFIVSIFMSAIPATTVLDERNRANRRLQRAHALARHARAAAEAANAAKSQFLANVSHEIRTPLNGVLGMAQAMAADAMPPVQRDRLHVIQSSGEALLAILNDVLDLSKIEAGKLELEWAALDIADVCQDAYNTFAPLGRKKGLGLTLTIDPDAAGAYVGDPTRLRQVLHNLLSNALKFTETGEVSLQVLPRSPGLLIRVVDTGIGISADHASRLFRKFEQADVSTTRRFGGSGLGLAICRELVQRMGGQVDVESALGHGSIFSVTLPWARAACDAVTPRDEAKASLADGAQASGRILAVDDNPMNLLVLKTLLGQIGLSPETAGDGAAALEAWEAQDWDLILMDVQMPVLDGLAATRRIREREAETGRTPTPIIALTADVMSHQVVASRAAGMNGLVGKPIDAHELFSAVTAALEGGDLWAEGPLSLTA
jgi:signal transduction histidine kinase/CheY-like chemotaxis protein